MGEVQFPVTGAGVDLMGRVYSRRTLRVHLSWGLKGSGVGWSHVLYAGSGGFNVPGGEKVESGC